MGKGGGEGGDFTATTITKTTGRRGVICDLDYLLWFTFTVDTSHCLRFYSVESSKPTFDRLTNQAKYYPMHCKTAEGNDLAIFLS